MFKNVPSNLKVNKKGKVTDRQALALAYYRTGSTLNAVLCILSDMSNKEHIEFYLSALKTSRFKTYGLAIKNLEDAINHYKSTKDERELLRVKKTFNSTEGIDLICSSILTLINENSRSVKHDYSWISVIGYTMYCFEDHDNGMKAFLADLLKYKYKNENFGLLYGK